MIHNAGIGKIDGGVIADEDEAGVIRVIFFRAVRHDFMITYEIGFDKLLNRGHK